MIVSFRKSTVILTIIHVQFVRANWSKYAGSVALRLMENVFEWDLLTQIAYEREERACSDPERRARKVE